MFLELDGWQLQGGRFSKHKVFGTSSEWWETQKVCLTPRENPGKPLGNPHPHLIFTIPMRRSDGEVWCVVRPDGRWNVNTNVATNGAVDE